MHAWCRHHLRLRCPQFVRDSSRWPLALAITPNHALLQPFHQLHCHNRLVPTKTAHHNPHNPFTRPPLSRTQCRHSLAGNLLRTCNSNSNEVPSSCLERTRQDVCYLLTVTTPLTHHPTVPHSCSTPQADCRSQSSQHHQYAARQHRQQLIARWLAMFTATRFQVMLADIFA